MTFYNMHQDSSETNLNIDDLSHLTGVNAFDTAIFENDVIQQIDKDVKAKQRVVEQKKINNIKKEIGSLKSLIRQNENAGEYFATKPSSISNQQKLKTLIIQREKYVSSLKICEQKLKSAEKYIATLSESTVKPSTSGTKDNLTNSIKFDKTKVSGARTLKERRELIKQGLETPFSIPTTQPTAPIKQPTLRLDNQFLDSLSTDAQYLLKQKKTTPKKSIPPDNSLKRSGNNDVETEEDTKRRKDSTDEEFVPQVEDHSESDVDEEEKITVSQKKKIRNTRCIDDANPRTFKKRVLKYKQRLIQEQIDGIEIRADKVFDGGFKIPGRIWQKLYKYQQTGVKWLWELHAQHAGGILGDEMGLGKTIQVISFLAGLFYSKLRDRDAAYSYDGLGPVLLVAPATVMHQWVTHLHSWLPQVRTAILHSSGSHRGANGDLISNIVLSRGILITSYERVRISIDELLSKNWHYVILDEGHKIKNPDSAVTHAIKLFPTPHRIILSGTPIQNNLKELWSLFDFVFPGKLGTLPVFMEQFSIPIVQGGYACATDVQVQTAYKCACMLKTTIAPYLLRRMKADVKSHLHLPDKTDQVLFCSMTDHQVEVYKQYLDSETVHSILSRNTKIFVGLIQLRKICNHPDLYTGGHKLLTGQVKPEYGDEKRFGHWERSGKMVVVESLLRIWKKQNKKVLLFSQSKAMLMILEDFVKSQNYSYVLMHGGTAIQSRNSIVNSFNEDPNIFVFLLTTRVGGLGINLVGADRVLLFDPDWNPSTDAQAQERAWRIGQNKQVTIYRLITTGTIEEKIYHRQIFKHFVSNRVLKDPRQRRFFKNNDMHELFTLKDQDAEKISKTETASIFAGTGSEVNIKEKAERKREKRENKRIKQEQRRKNLTKNSFAIDNPLPNANSAAKDNNKNQEKLLNVSKTFCNNNNTLNLSEPNNDSNIPISTPETTSEYAAVLLPNKNSEDFLQSVEDATDKTDLIQSNASHDITNDISGPKNRSSDICSSKIQVNPDSNDMLLPNTSTSNMSLDTFKTADQIQPITSDTAGNSPTTTPTKLRSSFLKVLEKFKSEKTVPKKEKSTKRSRKCDVDGEIVQNVVKRSKYKTKEVDKERARSDDYVLAKLFNKGVHSALKHATIMDSSTHDYAIVESEANRVAKEAIKNLKKSRKQYRYPKPKRSVKPRFGNSEVFSQKKEKTSKPKINSGFTSQLNFSKNKKEIDSSSSEDDKTNGATTKPNFGAAKEPCSSSQLLLQMRRRNHFEEDQKSDSEDSSNELETNDFTDYMGTENATLLHQLVNFIDLECGGEVSTSKVMEKFNGFVATEDAPKFKSMLHHVCVMTKDFDGTTKWVLKNEFR